MGIVTVSYGFCNISRRKINDNSVVSYFVNFAKVTWEERTTISPLWAALPGAPPGKVVLNGIRKQAE